MDFNVNNDGLQLIHNGANKTINNLSIEQQHKEKIATLSKEIYDACNNDKPIHAIGNQYAYTDDKSRVLYLFKQVVQYLGVDSTFAGGVINAAVPSMSIDYTYGAQAAQYKGITKNSDDSTVIVEHDEASGYTMIGPFNMNFSGKAIHQIGVSSDQGNFVDGTGGGIYYNTYYKTVDGAADMIGTHWINNLNTIPSGVDFYILLADPNKAFCNGNNLKVTFYQEGMEYYRARLILAKNPASNGQNMGIIAALPNSDYYVSQQTYNVMKRVPVDLTVVKTGDDSVKQSNVSFRIGTGILGEGYATWGSSSIRQDGTIIYSDITYSDWTEDIDKNNKNHQTFTTGTTGKFIVQGLKSSYTYHIHETGNLNTGYGNVDIKNATLSNGVANIKLGNTNVNSSTNNLVSGVKLSSTTENVLEIIDRQGVDPDTFNITINKRPVTGTTPLAGAEFKIKVLDTDGKTVIGWLKKISDTEYEYDDTKYENATTWSTTKTTKEKENFVYADTKGEIVIKDLNTEYKYEIYETKQADGYIHLQSQIIRLASGELSTASMTVKINNNSINDILYIEKDNIIYCGTTSYIEHGASSNIVVNNRPDVSGSTTPNPPPTPTYVDIEGRVWEDTINKTYNNVYDDGDRALSGVTVKLKKMEDGTQLASTQTNSSGIYTFTNKVTSDELSYYYIEISYNGINSTYRIVEPGTGDNASRAKYQANGIAWTDGIDDSNKSHINIGIRKLPTEEQSVEKWVEKIRVQMKDTDYTYYYGKNNTSVGNVSGVGVGNSAYHRTIYASDISYSREHDFKEGLEVYVTYKIRVSNDTPTYNNEKCEINMTATVVDVYDKNYYKLEDSNWNGSNGRATYKNTLTLNRYGQSNYSKTLDITFKLTDTALDEILEKGSFTAGNKVEITGKHNYKQYEQVDTKPIKEWRSGGFVGIRYYPGRWVTVGWEPVYKWVDHTLSYSEQNYAPGMTFAINEHDERKISGTVFKDEKVSTNGEVLGNGICDSNEEVLKDVKVDLLDENKEVATRYVYNPDIEARYEIYSKDLNNAQVITNEKGYYEFKGIVPGKYYIRFTYGNGEQDIYDSSGNLVSENSVKAYDYKSTIVTNTTLKNIFKGNSNIKNWYRNIQGATGYSIAIDDISITSARVNLNKNGNKTVDIIADTPIFEFKIENDKNNDSDNQNGDSDAYEIFDIKNMNFGIIDTPKIELGFEKKMINVKVTNTQGNVIINGNPGSKDIKIKDLSNLDTKEYLIEGSDYAKIEINDEELYGAKLEITYALTIINDSDVNYYNSKQSEYGYYYKFGEKDKEVTIEIEQVNDYLDDKLILIGNNHGIANENTYKNDNYININQDWKELYTQKGPNKDKSTDTAVLQVTRTLSNTETDMDFENQAKVINIEATNNPLVEKVDKHKSDDEYTNYFKYTKDSTKFENPSKTNVLLIVPETGLDKLTPLIYISLIAIAGTIITFGIIVIKKKVL